MSRIHNQSVFNFCAIPQVSTIKCSFLYIDEKSSPHVPYTSSICHFSVCLLALSLNADNGHSNSCCMLQQPQCVHWSGEDTQGTSSCTDDGINQHAQFPGYHVPVCKRSEFTSYQNITVYIYMHTMCALCVMVIWQTRLLMYYIHVNQDQDFT